MNNEYNYCLTVVSTFVENIGAGAVKLNTSAQSCKTMNIRLISYIYDKRIYHIYI